MPFHHSQHTLGKIFIVMNWSNQRELVGSAVVDMFLHCIATWTFSSAKCCDKLQWCPLSVLQQYLGLLFLFKIIYCMIDLKFDDYFVFADNRTRSLGLSTDKMQVILCLFISSLILFYIFWNRLVLVDNF